MKNVYYSHNGTWETPAPPVEITQRLIDIFNLIGEEHGVSWEKFVSMTTEEQDKTIRNLKIDKILKD